MTIPTAYIETTVIGHLVGRMLADPIVAGRQTVTRQWWPSAIARYRFFVSKMVADECAAGDSDAAKERLAVLDSLEFLSTSPSVDELARKLIEGFAVPKTEPRDAVHISLAAVNGIEYLISWNFKHIVNPTTRSAIERICRDAGFVPPMICTPDELLEV
ncbi:MAG: type II toxin-antitoxin system VapC family toxin [Planctomycetaceae bacterium]